MLSDVFFLIDQELRDFENHVTAHYSERGGNVIFSSEQQKVRSISFAYSTINVQHLVITFSRRCLKELIAHIK